MYPPPPLKAPTVMLLLIIAVSMVSLLSTRLLFPVKPVTRRQVHSHSGEEGKVPGEKALVLWPTEM